MSVFDVEATEVQVRSTGGEVVIEPGFLPGHDNVALITNPMGGALALLSWPDDGKGGE